MQSIENVLYVKKGALVGIPAAGVVGILFDPTGTLKIIDETGAVNPLNVLPAAVIATVSSAVQDVTVTVSGESGSTFLITGNLSLTAGIRTLTMQINGVTTSQAIQYVDLASGAATGTAGCVLFTSPNLGGAMFCSFAIIMTCHTGQKRGGSVSSIVTDAASGTGGRNGAFYFNDAATAITSLVFHGDSASCITGGSISVQVIP